MFALARSEGGASVADHLARHEQATGQRVSPLQTVYAGPPRGTQAVWTAFRDLDRTRPQGFSGPLPITYAEIDAYCRLKDIVLSDLELDCLMRLDEAKGRAMQARKGNRGG